MTITLDPAPTLPDVRRDRWGRYLILPPDGGKPRGYQRATTLAKMLEDTAALMDWACRMTLLGAAARPDILAAAQTTDPDDRKALNGIVERAKEAGGATVRRDLGTALHKMVELSHADPTYSVPLQYAADVAAVNATIAAHGYEVVTEFSESVLVLDDISVAGMCDMVLRRVSDGRLFIADLKTGSSVAYGALGYSVQLTAYAHATGRYRQGFAEDGSEDVRLPAPDVDRTVGFILHAQPGAGRCDLHELELSRERLDLAVAVREARKAKNLLKIVGEGAGHGSPPPPATTAGEVPPVPSPAVTPVDPLDRHDWLLGRIDCLIDYTGARELLARLWPQDITRPKYLTDGQTYTDAQVDLIVAAVQVVEAEVQAQFHVEDPKVTAERKATLEAAVAAEAERLRRPEPEPAPEPEPVGEVADADAVDRLKAWVKEMGESEQRPLVAHMQQWQDQGAAKGVSWKVGAYKRTAVPFDRYVRCAAALACVDLIDLDATDPDHRVRSLLHAVTGDDLALKPTSPVGALIGLLTVDQALRMAEMVAATTP